MRRGWTLVLSCALAHLPYSEAATQYYIEPFMLEHVTVLGDKLSRTPATRFLTMVLAVAPGDTGQAYRHVLPSTEAPPAGAFLELRPRTQFTDNVLRQHPFERPFVRVLMYWGCGRHLGRGQPRVIQTGAIDDEQLTRILAPSPRDSRDSVGTEVSASGEAPLVVYNNVILPHRTGMRGAHELRMGPKIARFAVEDPGDFIPAVKVTQVQVSKRDGATLRWERSPAALAYFANMYVHHEGSREVIIWTSSRIAEAGYLLAQSHPGDEEIIRLRAKGILMHADADTCTIPAAVTRHASEAMTIQVHALGPTTTSAAISQSTDQPSLTVRIAPRATATITLPNATSLDSSTVSSNRRAP